MIQAIETEYKGYRFRSRLEARWAVAFDALKLDWLYEEEGFSLPSGARYLPDFKVKYPMGATVYCEVKGVSLGDLLFKRDAIDGVDKAQEFADSSGLLVYVLGDIPHISQPCGVCLMKNGHPRIVDPFGYLSVICGIDTDDAYRAARSARFEHGEAQHGR